MGLVGVANAMAAGKNYSTFGLYWFGLHGLTCWAAKVRARIGVACSLGDSGLHCGRRSDKEPACILIMPETGFSIIKEVSKGKKQ